MELSNFEKLELDKIAQGLDADYPRLARLLSTPDLRRHRWKKTEGGVIVALGGLGLMLLSFPLGSLPLGVLGFLVMGAGSYWATLFMDDQPLRRRRTATQAEAGTDQERGTP